MGVGVFPDSPGDVGVIPYAEGLVTVVGGGVVLEFVGVYVVALLVQNVEEPDVALSLPAGQALGVRVVGVEGDILRRRPTAVG